MNFVIDKGYLSTREFKMSSCSRALMARLEAGLQGMRLRSRIFQADIGRPKCSKQDHKPEN